MPIPKLLSPAGSEEALRAAVDCGADEVYLGYTSFGARASAVNFDKEALSRSVQYAHLHHVRVYVTVNILVKPGEFSGVREALSVISEAGADAVIVQDLGVARLVRQAFPALHLHASTQMALCNAEGALTAQRLGFDRVVLARECYLKDIRQVAATGMETEVFAHGALCTAVSGRCLMSSMSGGRSGNRGRCAQPCRQCFQLTGSKGPLLSLKDLCLLDDLPALCQAGVTSLKIEGRLKSPEYVAVVTGVYRKALDDIAAGRFRPGDSAAKEQLMQIFNRGGFTRGHAMGAEDAELVTPRRVSHEGLPLGEILQVRHDLATLRVQRDLHDGDSLQLRGREDGETRYAGHDVAAGGVTTLRLRPGLNARPGMSVFRLSDARQLEQARCHAPAPISVCMNASFFLGEPMTLSLSDGQSRVTVRGPVAAAAQNRSSTPDEVCKQLSRLGGTPFTMSPSALTLELEEGLFLPVGALNALRREAVARLTAARIAAFTRPAASRPAAGLPGFASQISVFSDTLAVIFSDPELAQPLWEAGATLPVWAPRLFTPEALEVLLPRLPRGCWLRLPPQLTQETLDAVRPVIDKHSACLGGLWLESVGYLSLSTSLPVIAGEGIPAANAEGLETLRQSGVSAYCRWPEWTFAEQRQLPDRLPSLLKLYGREVLMLLNHCPERVARGLCTHRNTCALCENDRVVCGQAGAALTDRKGYRFPLTRTRFPEGCEIQVLGALPTDLRERDSDRRALNAAALLHFTTETAQEQLALTRQFSSLLRGQDFSPSPVPTTCGHWLRGVE